MDAEDLKVVHEFLLNLNFENTAKALIAEAEKRGLPNFEKDSNSNDKSINFREQIIASYEGGDWRNFFRFWDMLTPEDVKESKEYKILTLKLHVHFAVWPKRILLSQLYKERNKTDPEVGDPITCQGNDIKCKEAENFMTEIEKSGNDNMEQLREYLNTAGKELEQETELRPFFALPFIEDPYAEPFLSKVFEKCWLDQLTESLQGFLDKNKENFNHSNSINNNGGSISLLSVKERAGSTRKSGSKSNIPIIPNDRNIPVFLEDNESGEGYKLYNSKRCCPKSKSIQTNIKGVQHVINDSGEDLNSESQLRNDKRISRFVQELSATKSHLCSIHFNYERLKLRFHKLHADYHKLISVAGELTAALENSVKGRTVDLQAMLETCIKIFPDLFNQNVRDSSHNFQVSSLQEYNASCIEMKSSDYSAFNVTSSSPKLLDFKKIKLHLINGNVKTKLFLLQALRREVTVGPPGERDEAIHEYISRDLLGLHGQIASDNGKTILPYLFAPGNIITPHPLQQSAARLLNVLASFRCGRDYLSYGSTVVTVILKCLSQIRNNEVDTITCNMMIAMLQKLSLRRQQRIYMIENGLVEWLIHHLHDECHVMDSYRLEYSTALLMNLSLHRLAQTRASVMASLLISTLLTLLSINHAPALPYVNGTLNNFLSNPTINEEAKKMKLSSALEYYRQRTTGEIRKHLDHILEKHNGESTVNIDDDDTADDDNEEYDVLENELEENDPVKNSTGELCGKALLATYYVVSLKELKEKKSDVLLQHSRIHCMHEFRGNGMVFNGHKSATSSNNCLPRSTNKRYGLKNKNKVIQRNNQRERNPLAPKCRQHVRNLNSFQFEDEEVYNKLVNEENSFSSRDITAVKGCPSFSRFLNAKNKNRNRSPQMISIDPRNSTGFHKNIRGLGKLKKSSETGRDVLLDRRALTKAKDSSRNSQQDATMFDNKWADFQWRDARKSCDKSAVYLFENQTSKGKSNDNANSINNTSQEDQEDVDIEEAFLSKPKISRTPT